MMGYSKLRTIHLCVALFLLAFLAVYAVSAVQLAHRTWFATKLAVARQRVAIPADAASTRAVAKELMDRGVVRGELRGVEGQRFTVVRPGVRSSVSCTAGSCEVTTTSAGVPGTLIGLHALAGFGHVTAALNVWGAFAALVSLGLFVLGATGAWMSLANRADRWTNAAILALPLIAALYLMVAMRLSP